MGGRSFGTGWVELEASDHTPEDACSSVHQQFQIYGSCSKQMSNIYQPTGVTQSTTGCEGRCVSDGLSAVNHRQIFNWT